MEQQRQGALSPRRLSRRMGVVLGACALVGAAACADVPTAAERPATSALTRSTGVSAGGITVEVICLTSHATPGGLHAYQYGRLTVKLPASTRAADGSTRPYSYRGHAGERVVLAADCTIPNTAAAGERMNRVFGAKGQPVTSAGGKPDDTVIQSSDYMLEPLHVYACQYGGDYPHCNLPPPPGGTDERPCYEGEACGPDGYMPTGGGDDYDPTQPDPCNTGNSAIDAPAVQGDFPRLWGESNATATDQMQRRERANFVIQKADGSHTYQPFPEEWISGPCEINIPPDAKAPEGTVGIIHTHPWQRGEPQVSCGPTFYAQGQPQYPNYNGMFTADDQVVLSFFEQQTGRSLKGYVLDFEGIKEFTATSSTYTALGRCAY